MISITKKDYSVACAEVLKILKYIPKEAYEKVPKEVITALEKMQDLTYYFSIDFNKSIEEQNITEITKAILANFYRDYWATPEERKDIIRIEQQQRECIEEEKRRKYNPDSIFKKEEEKHVEMNLIPLKKNKSFTEKVFDFIKRILKKFYCK